jgi:hypothetical protein
MPVRIVGIGPRPATPGPAETRRLLACKLTAVRHFTAQPWVNIMYWSGALAKLAGAVVGLVTQLGEAT